MREAEVIVRLLGEGQFRVDDALIGRLNELDDEVAQAVEAGDERALWSGLQALADAVREHGEKLADDDLSPSDAIIPPEDLSLEEAQELLAGRGLHPDVPAVLTREVVLAARPQGEPQASDFELREADIAEPADGEVLVRNVFVSVDPYMRGRMSGIRTYVGPYEVGEPIDGGAVGRVVASRYDGFAEGDWVALDARLVRAGVVGGRRACASSIRRSRRRRPRSACSACPASPPGSGSSRSPR